MPISFITSLNSENWDPHAGGWRCDSLKIPGAKVYSIFAEGNEVDKVRYSVRNDLSFIRWSNSHPPKQIIVGITLEDDLVTNELKIRWKKAAIILPFVTAIIATIITTLVPQIFNPQRHKDASVLSPKENSDSTIKNPIQTITKYVTPKLYPVQNINGTWDNDLYVPRAERWEVIQKDGDSIVYIYRNPGGIRDIGVGFFDRTSNLFRVFVYREGSNCYSKFSFIWELSKKDNKKINFSYRALQSGGGACGDPIVNKLYDDAHLIKQ